MKALLLINNLLGIVSFFAMFVAFVKHFIFRFEISERQGNLPFFASLLDLSPYEKKVIKGQLFLFLAGLLGFVLFWIIEFQLFR